MKLYSEEQVRKMLEVCIDSDLYEHILTFEDIFKTETPIELPSDEEIKEMRKAYLEEVNDIVHADLERDGYLGIGFHVGAKLMRDKIQGGNK